MTTEWGSLNHTAYQQLTVSTVAVGLTLPTGAATQTPRRMLIVVETNGVRWRADGTNPTASVGMPLFTNGILDLTDKSTDFWGIIQQIKFIRSGAADATLNIAYFG